MIVAKKKKSLAELKAEEERVKKELKIQKQNIRILEAEQKELTRRKRVNRLCTHGAMLEQYLKPEVFSDEQIEVILKTIFRWNDVAVFVNDMAKQAKSSEEPETS